jgi:hypothetical protein
MNISESVLTRELKGPFRDISKHHALRNIQRMLILLSIRYLLGDVFMCEEVLH